MISYAGVPLCVPDAATLAAVEGAIDPPTLNDWSLRAWPGRGQDRISFPGHQPDVPLRVNTLHWPVGASRWAVFRGLVDDEMLSQIGAHVYGASSGYQAATLLMDEGAEGRVGYALETSMYMLPPRPVWQAGAPSGLWLITLVDDRWFWWQRSGVVSVTGGTTTWATLYAAVATLLGITITVEAVPAAYQYPSEDIASQYEALPTLLDAIALSVGQRIVRGLDGSVRAAYPVAERTILTGDLAADHPRMSGGLYRLAVPPPDDVPAQVPASVTMTFPRRAVSGAATGDLYAVATTLTSLALTEAAGKPGHPGNHYAHSSLPAQGASGTPTNLADLTALAARWATDWYRWRLGWIDVAYAGIVPWALEGFHDVVWTLLTDQCHTRVRAASGGGLCGGIDALPGGGTTINYTDSDGTTLVQCCERRYARITERLGFAYSWVEAELIVPDDGTFATLSGTSFQDIPDGLFGVLNLYERNRWVNIPIDMHVEIWRNGDDWLCDFEMDHFKGEIVSSSGGGIYVVDGVDEDDNKRTVTATEFNGVDLIAIGTRVLVWVYKSGTILSYGFEYAMPRGDTYVDIDITQVSITNIQVGDTVTIINSVTGVVINYVWQCFDLGCGWINLCTCEMVPWWCVDAVCVQSETEPVGATGGPYATPTLCAEADCVDDIDDCDNCPDGAPEYYRVTISGGTGDFAQFNGSWTLSYIEDCQWRISRRGVTLILTMEEEGVVYLRGYGFLNALVVYTGEHSQVCCQSSVLTLLESTGSTGTAASTAMLDPISECPEMYWCVGGECVQAAEEPEGATGGPYDTEAECEATDCGPIVTECCPDDAVSQSLLGTITNKTGDCSCIEDSVSLAYDDIEEVWYSAELEGGCGNAYRFRFFCTGPGCIWTFDDILMSPSVPTITLVSCSCDPFEVVLDVTVPAGPPQTCTGSFRITITESP